MDLKTLQNRRSAAYDSGDRAAYDAFDLLIAHAIGCGDSTLAVYRECNRTLAAVRAALLDECLSL